MSAKSHAKRQGVVGTASLATVYQREIFFQVDPSTLDYLDARDFQSEQPSGVYIDFDPIPLLDYLPEEEAEIFWMIFEKRKEQKHIATLLGFSQPTISYRWRRVLAKLSYLLVLDSLPVREMVENDTPFLKPRERAILHDLFFYTNQERVGNRHGVRQSSVKWIYSKTLKRVKALEGTDPDRWRNFLGLLFLLERNLSSRIVH